MTTRNPEVFRILTDLGMPGDEARRQLENNTLNLNPYSHRVTDDILITIAENCAELKSINLSTCDNITNAGVMGIAENCAGLTTISLTGCDNITDATLISHAENSEYLDHIKLRKILRSAQQDTNSSKR